MTTERDKDPTMIAQRQFFRSLGVREYDEAKRCPRCRNRSWVRTKDDICLTCKIREGKK